MPSNSENLLNDIKGIVYKKQKNVLKGLKEKYVERDGKLFLIVEVDYKKNKVTVSDTKTPINVLIKFSIQSFLSKAIMEVEKV